MVSNYKDYVLDASELRQGNASVTPRAASLIRAVPFILVMSLNALLLWFFHDHFWYPSDEGNYAHVAQRLLAGQVLNLQVQDVHAGYINFVNAAALKLFGTNLLSLRYPLVFIALAQGALVFALVNKRAGLAMGASASVAITALGVIQFLNPTANWYCLFFAILITCCFDWIPRERASRLFIVGLLIGMVLLFRQLSGILLAIGVLAYVLIDTPASKRVHPATLPRLLIAIMTAGLAWYFFRTTDLVGFFLFGLCPFAVLVWLWTHTGMENRQLVRVITQLSLGGITAALPLLLYHLINGSLGTWLEDVAFGAAKLTKLGFMNQKLFGILGKSALYQTLRFDSFGEVVNGLYWIALLLLALVNGVLVVRFLSRRSDFVSRGLALPVLAVFYAIVSIHFQIPIYVYYTAGFSLVACLVHLTSKRARFALIPVALGLSAIGVYYHAAQPLSRSQSDVLKGIRAAPDLGNDGSLMRSSLKIQPDDRVGYAELIRLIESETKPGETIFALPSSAELYFLSGRENPFRFYNSALGIRTDRELQLVINTIVNRPPKLVMYKPSDKYNTPYSKEIMTLVGQRYAYLGKMHGFEVYRSAAYSQSQGTF